MYYRKLTNEYIHNNTSFIVNDIQYPANWLSVASEEEIKSLGLVEVITVGEFKDAEYYDNSEVLEKEVITISSTPKDLIDLKNKAILITHKIAYNILYETDWMVVKSIETAIPLDEKFALWRASIRKAAKEKILQIEKCETNDDLALIMQTSNWPKKPDAEGN